MRLSVCVETLFRDEPFLDRLRRVAELGFPGFEFWRQDDKDLEAIARLRDELNLTWVGMVGTSLPLTDPQLNDAVVSELEKSIAAAKDVGCLSLIVTSGRENEQLDRDAQHDNIVEILKAVAPSAEKANVTIVLEPLNTAVNHPGTYLSSSYEGYEILRKVNSSHVKLLFDIYHQQITEGNVTANFREHIDLIGHFHIADVPGRHEPGTGELHYANILRAISETGYQGFVGCEFRPSGDDAAALEYVKQLL